jgi:hypothetical protein
MKINGLLSISGSKRRTYPQKMWISFSAFKPPVISTVLR